MHIPQQKRNRHTRQTRSQNLKIEERIHGHFAVLWNHPLEYNIPKNPLFSHVLFFCCSNFAGKKKAVRVKDPNIRGWSCWRLLLVIIDEYSCTWKIA